MFYRMIFKIISESDAVYWNFLHAEFCQTQLDTAASDFIRFSMQSNSWSPVQMIQASNLVDQWVYISFYTHCWIVIYCVWDFENDKRSWSWFFLVFIKRFESLICLQLLVSDHSDQHLITQPLTSMSWAECWIDKVIRQIHYMTDHICVS